MQFITRPIEEFQSAGDQLPVFTQETGAASSVHLSVNPQVECEVDACTLCTGSCGPQQMLTVADDTLKHVFRNRVPQPECNEVHRVVDLPVRQASASANLDETWLCDEVVVSQVFLRGSARHTRPGRWERTEDNTPYSSSWISRVSASIFWSFSAKRSIFSDSAV